MEEVSAVQVPALTSVAERAKGIKYVDPLTTSWLPPRYIRDMPEEQQRVRTHARGLAASVPCADALPLRVVL